MGSLAVGYWDVRGGAGNSWGVRVLGGSVDCLASGDGTVLGNLEGGGVDYCGGLRRSEGDGEENEAEEAQCVSRVGIGNNHGELFSALWCYCVCLSRDESAAAALCGVPACWCVCAGVGLSRRSVGGRQFVLGGECEMRCSELVFRGVAAEEMGVDKLLAVCLYVC